VNLQESPGSSSALSPLALLHRDASMLPNVSAFEKHLIVERWESFFSTA
jgi:hypothetical protein